MSTCKRSRLGPLLPGDTGRSAVKRLANLVQREALVLTYNDAIMLVGPLSLAARFVMPLVRHPNTTSMSPEPSRKTRPLQFASSAAPHM